MPIVTKKLYTLVQRTLTASLAETKYSDAVHKCL